MLRTEVKEIVRDGSGKVQGIVGVFDEQQGAGPETVAATCDVLVGDPSYFQDQKTPMVRKSGTVIRSTCILNHPVPNTKNSLSAQIIMPARHLSNKQNDIFVSVLSEQHEVTPRRSGSYLAIVSTVAETQNPVAELAEGFKVLGDISMQFNDIQDMYEPLSNGMKDKVFITRSYDATSHFEYESREVLHIYERIMGQPLDLSKSVEELQKEQAAAMGM